jgi:Protein of unknown function (DUF3617)
MMKACRLNASLRILATALLGAAVGSPALADGISPGLWQVTETVVMNGNASTPQVRTRCLSAEQAGDTGATFSPEYRTVNSDCERTEFESTASKLKWRMMCKGQLDMDVSGDFTFDTPKHYTAKIQSKGSMAGREFVNTSVAVEGEHLGECQ